MAVRGRKRMPGRVVLRNVGVVPPVLPRSGTGRTTAPNGSRSRRRPACVPSAGDRAGRLDGVRARPVRVRVRRRLLDGGLGGRRQPPYPSLADAGYLSIFPPPSSASSCCCARGHRDSGRALWLDGLVCAFSAAAVGAALVLGVVASTEGSFAAVATNLAYPLGDLSMLAFVIAVMVIAGRSGRVDLVGASRGARAWAVADGIYLTKSRSGRTRSTRCSTRRGPGRPCWWPWPHAPAPGLTRAAFAAACSSARGVHTDRARRCSSSTTTTASRASRCGSRPPPCWPPSCASG